MNEKVIVASGDSDMRQLLLQPNVSVYDLGKKPRSYVKPLDADDPEDADPARWKAVVGDVSDEIPGITGPITARKLLADEAAFQAALDAKTCRSKLDKGRAWREVYDRNLKLVCLTGDRRLFPLASPRDVQQQVEEVPAFMSKSFALGAIELGFESWYTKGSWTAEGAKVLEFWSRLETECSF